jgi:dTDP-4-amino-4,6-dideoxygalactose transaminase
MDAIMAIARRHRLKVVEDCSQAFAATLNGRPVGSFGDAAAFSMNTMKGLAALGEAGAVAVDDDDLAERLTVLRYNGMANREECRYVSHNARLDTVQAALLLRRLRRHPDKVRARQALAAYYDRALASVVRTIPPSPGCDDVYYTYTVEGDRRDALRAHLEAAGIECRVQHAPLMPDQAPLRGRVRGDYPNARRLIERVLCLPMHEKIADAERRHVVNRVRDFYGASALAAE